MAARTSRKEGFLHLCSDEKVWAVKQISTSNSVHVTRMMSVEEVQRLETDRRDGDGDTAMDETQERVEGQAIPLGISRVLLRVVESYGDITSQEHPRTD